MRPPVVQRETPPGSGCLGVFPPASCWRRSPRATCADGVALGWRGPALGDPSAVGLGRDLSAAVGHVILAMGVLDGGQQLRPCAPARPPTSAQVARGAQGRGIDGGVGPQARAQAPGHLVGRDGGVRRCASVARWHRARGPQDTRHPCVGTHVRPPVPGDETCNRDHQRCTTGGHRLAQRLRAGGQMALPHELTVVVPHTDGPRASRQVEATVTWVLWGGEAPEVSSSSGGLFPRPADHGGMRRRGPQEVSMRCS